MPYDGCHRKATKLYALSTSLKSKLKGSKARAKNAQLTQIELENRERSREEKRQQEIRDSAIAEEIRSLQQSRAKFPVPRTSVKVVEGKGKKRATAENDEIGVLASSNTIMRSSGPTLETSNKPAIPRAPAGSTMAHPFQINDGVGSGVGKRQNAMTELDRYPQSFMSSPTRYPRAAAFAPKRASTIAQALAPPTRPAPIPKPPGMSGDSSSSKAWMSGALYPVPSISSPPTRPAPTPGPQIMSSTSSSSNDRFTSTPLERTGILTPPLLSAPSPFPTPEVNNGTYPISNTNYKSGALPSSPLIFPIPSGPAPTPTPPSSPRLPYLTNIRMSVDNPEEEASRISNTTAPRNARTGKEEEKDNVTLQSTEAPILLTSIQQAEMSLRYSNNPYRNGIYLLHKQGAGSQYVVELEGSMPYYEVA